MSKLMTRLEKLTDFQNRGENLKARALGLHAEQKALDDEFTKWLENEFGAKGQMHLSDILKIALETSYEKAP